MFRVLTAAMMLLVGVSVLQAQAPEPSIISEDWKFDFDYDKPRVIRVPNEKGGFDWYWYITYEVTNNNDEDLLFLPGFTIATDKGHIIEANRGISPLAFPAIKQELKNPLLDSPAAIVGNLRQGSDYAKQGVIIWKDLGEDIDSFDVFVAGLSGETTTVKHPVTGEEIYLRRTLKLGYETPGNPLSPKDQADTTLFVSEFEVMR